MKKDLIYWIVWLLLIIVWNYGVPMATPFQDVIIAVALSITFILLRGQLFVNETNWLKRMIPHHSTALTTTNKLINSGQIKKETQLYRLAKDIIFNQEREILLMKSYL